MSRFDRAALVLALAGAALAGCRSGEARRNTADDVAGGYRGMVLPRPLEKPDFTLTDTEGQPFDFRAETDGRLTLLFFGYTHCPDVCPVHLANLAAVIEGLPRPAQKRIKVVFVTVDPARDSPERIREWLDAFDPGFVGLRGERAAVDSVLRALQLPTPVLEAPDANGDYAVGHPTHIVAFTPDGVARVLYPFGTRQADWAYDLPRLLEVEPAVRVTDAYVAEPAAGGRAALYLTVENRAGEADSLVAVSADVAGRAEIHRQAPRGGAAVMERVPALEVPARGRVRLAPGGLHVMLMELKATPHAGDDVAIDLVFRRAGRVRARAAVRPYAELDSLLAGHDGHGTQGGS